MLDAGEAAVVFDALLERGEATWPGVGSFALVAVTKERLDRSAVVHVFPTRRVQFVADVSLAAKLKERGGRATLPGLGTLTADGFEPDAVLQGRVKVLAASALPRGGRTAEPSAGARTEDASRRAAVVAKNFRSRLSATLSASRGAARVRSPVIRWRSRKRRAP